MAFVLFMKIRLLKFLVHFRFISTLEIRGNLVYYQKLDITGFNDQHVNREKIPFRFFLDKGWVIQHMDIGGQKCMKYILIQ